MFPTVISTVQSRAVYYSTLSSTLVQPKTKMYFTYNNPRNYYYKPHIDLGRVGTSSSAHRAQRNRI